MADDELWVFGYGSLMWDPGFAVAEHMVASLEGYHRSFCMWSVHYRGTTETPGLVLALDRAPGARCLGLAFRVAPGHEADTLAILRARELISYAYYEARLPLSLRDGRRVEAVTYVIDPAHEQYCQASTLDEQAAIIARAAGTRGPNRDYLFNTVAHLAEQGIEDAELSALSQKVRALSG